MEEEGFFYGPGQNIGIFNKEKDAFTVPPGKGCPNGGCIWQMPLRGSRYEKRKARRDGNKNPVGSGSSDRSTGG